jgi:glycosyltransferase involved in cell wall biosynthesis
LVLIEAMAAGTPVVALESPGSADVLTKGGGVLVPAQEEAFANTVLALLADEPRRRVLGEQAVQAVQRYRISSVVAHLVDVYEEAIATGPRPPGKVLKELLQDIRLDLEVIVEEIGRGIWTGIK